MPAINLRLAHFPSRTPILLELGVDASITAQELRCQIESRLRVEDTCLMQMFGKWYFEVNDTKQFVEIVSSDSSDSLSSLGITDEAILCLEGPLLDSQEPSGKAIALQPAEEGRNPLHHAASNFQFECIEPLISKGADAIDVNARDSEGLTALQQAALHQQPDAMRALILRGANLNILDANQRTLMHLATEFPSSSLIDLFNKAAIKQRQQSFGASEVDNTFDGDRNSGHQNHRDPEREHNADHHGPNNNNNDNDKDNDINSTTLNTNDTQRGRGQLITVRFVVEEADAIKSTQISPNATMGELRLRFAAYELIQDSSHLKWLIYIEGGMVDISRTHDTEALSVVGIVDRSAILMTSEDPI